MCIVRERTVRGTRGGGMRSGYGNFVWKVCVEVVYGDVKCVGWGLEYRGAKWQSLEDANIAVKKGLIAPPKANSIKIRPQKGLIYAKLK